MDGSQYLRGIIRLNKSEATVDSEHERDERGACFGMKAQGSQSFIEIRRNYGDWYNN